MKTKILSFGVGLLALILSACGPTSPIPLTPTGVPTTAPTAVVPVTGSTPAASPTAVMPVTASTPSAGSASGAAAVNAAQNPSLGTILVDSKGMTLYIFGGDTANTSNCTGGCAATWPPLMTTGAPTAGTGINASLLGTITRSDGGTQVTYNGMPLYTFVGDKAAGDVTGQGVQNFFVINPAGMKVTGATSAGSSSSSGSSGSGSGSYPGYGPANNAPANPGSTGSGSGSGW